MKTDVIIIDKYDNPVGFWYKCLNCNKEYFIPDFDTNDKETDIFNYCPYCGREIGNIKNK